MSKPRVFVSRLIPEAGLARVKHACNVDLWTDELPAPREIIFDRVRNVDGVLSLLTDKMDGAVMDAAGPQLKVIANYAVGFDNIDVPAANDRGISVGYTPGVLTETTADFAFSLLMSAARRVVEGDRYTHEGHWQTWGPKLLLGQDIFGATLGLVGFGRIGKSVARRATGFNMKILYYDEYAPNDPYAKEIGAQSVDMDTLLRQSDFVSLHTPLTKETRHLISGAAFAKMKPTAILINTSRGPVVDPEALYHALKTGQIFAAGLDVTEPEPINMDSPLLSLPNLIIAPHIASATVATRNKMAEMAAENLIAGVTGNVLPYCANPDVYKTKK